VLATTSSSTKNHLGGESGVRESGRDSGGRSGKASGEKGEGQILNLDCQKWGLPLTNLRLEPQQIF